MPLVLTILQWLRMNDTPVGGGGAMWETGAKGTESSNMSLLPLYTVSSLYILKNTYLFIWLHWVLVAACRIFHCSAQASL